MNELATKRGAPMVLWIFAAIFCTFELVFVLSEAGFFARQDLRWIVYLLGAFWDHWFEAAMAGQPVPIVFWWSFVTHAFLHGSLLHLVMNTVVFLGLGSYVARGIGTLRFLVLFFLTAIAGALVFAMMSDAAGPMVGASGALFGVMGALKFWERRYILETGAPSNRFWGTIIGLIILNAVLAFYYPGGGSLAWQAHLGGFLAGYLLAPVIAPNIMGPSPI